MVLKKKQEYGFYGYKVPFIPRAPRSLRRRGSHKKSLEDGQICAFELLAAVAGKLLQESESSASSNAAEGKEQLRIHKDDIKKEQKEGKAIRSECLDQGSCIESVVVPHPAAREQNLKSTLEELLHAESDSVLDHASLVKSSDFLNKISSDVKLEKYTSIAVGNNPSKSYGVLHADGQLYYSDLGDEAKTQLQVLGKQTEHVNGANTSDSKDPMELHVNTNKLINSESSVQLPLYRDHPNASFPRHRNDVKIVNRDDDDNYFRRNQLNTKTRAYRSQSRIGYRRIRKLLTSRYWKAGPKLKDYELPNSGRGVNSFYRKRKTIYIRDRFEQDDHSKRRKLCDHNSIVAYDQEASSESISNSPEKVVKGEKSGSAAISHRETGETSSAIGHKASFQSKDSHVKFSIKSFKVPELYIEVPETTTVGSLKRTVMEAVTAILGGGLHVGVVLQGKKIGDDNITLQQTGISQTEDLDTLGFTLEPSFAQAASPLSHKDPLLLLPCDSRQQLSRSSAPILDSGLSNSSFDQPPVTNLDNYNDIKHEIVPSTTDISTTDGTVADSKALVAIPPLNAEALSMVPINSKTKRLELSQRRARRPFSVSEVEALVEAVEKLGTGRWRDVKMRAFDDANHRTYVDLKDKWKTLVHTASIAPQQRRGEPVPQELLDRVLAAHAYWSQHQSKQQGKHQAEPIIKLAGETKVCSKF